MANYQENNKKFWDEHFSKVSLDYPNEEVIRFLARCKKLYTNGGRVFDDFRTQRDSLYLKQKNKNPDGFTVDSEDSSIVGNYINILPIKELKKCF